MTMQKQLLAVPLQTVRQKRKTLSCKCKHKEITKRKYLNKELPQIAECFL